MDGVGRMNEEAWGVGVGIWGSGTGAGVGSAMLSCRVGEEGINQRGSSRGDMHGDVRSRAAVTRPMVMKECEVKAPSRRMRCSSKSLA